MVARRVCPSSPGSWVAFVCVVGVLVVVLSGPASAHRPLFSGDGGGSPETAVRVPDPTVSHVLYFELTDETPHFWFVFDLEHPSRLPVQLAVPAGVGSRNTEPVVRIERPVGAEPPVAVVRSAGAPERFDEPVTGTSSWIVADTEVELPHGTYYGVVVDESGRGGKFWVAVGRRESFTWRDVWRLPGVIQAVRRFHEEPGRPPWMWVAGAVFTATPPTLGWLGGRLRKSFMSTRK